MNSDKTNPYSDQKIRWIHNGVSLESNKRNGIKITDDGDRMEIKIKSSRRHWERQAGRYSCVAGLDGMFLMSAPALLSIAHIDKFPSSTSTTSVVGNVGNNVILPCKPPTSVPPPIIQWFKDGSPVLLEERSSLVSYQHLLLENIGLEQAGLYSCHASNHLAQESVVSNQQVNLTVLPEGDHHKPRLLMEPSTEYRPVLGENLTIPCSASGSPKPTIIWEHEAFNSEPQLLQQTGPRELLQLSNVNQNSSGQYTCKMWNHRGRKILRKTLVSVAEKPGAVISSFSSDPHMEGDPLELYCQVSGFPIPEVHWIVNGKRKYRGKNRGADTPLSESGKLLIRQLKLEDAGIYQCFAENDVSTVYDAVKVRVVPNMRNSTEYEESEENRKRNRNRNEKQLSPPSSPNVTQLSEDSVMLTWSMPNISQDVKFFKVQYRDLGKIGENYKSDWYTMDGVITPSIRSYEIPGLKEHHAYRFRVGAVIGIDHVLSKVSKRFRLEANTNKAPTVTPQIKQIHPISETSLYVRWILAENATVKDHIEGYFINFRLTSSAGDYSHLTIFGDSSHSHILDNLEPGERYDVKVSAFNLNGAGPASKIEFGATKGHRKTREKEKKRKLDKSRTAPSLSGSLQEGEEEDRMYLIIGVSLGCVCVVLFTCCMVLTLCRRQNKPDKFSSSNAIHAKYQDTSLQISSRLQYAGARPEEQERTDTSLESQASPAIHETSFSVTTDHSCEAGMDQYSQGSTVFVQVSQRYPHHLSKISSRFSLSQMNFNLYIFSGLN